MESHKLLRDYGRLTADKADKTILDHVWSRALTVTMKFTAYSLFTLYRRRLCVTHITLLCYWSIYI